MFFCLKKQEFQRQTHMYNTQVGLISILETSWLKERKQFCFYFMTSNN